MKYCEAAVDINIGLNEQRLAEYRGTASFQYSIISPESIWNCQNRKELKVRYQ